MGEKNCEKLPLKNGPMGAQRPDSLPLPAASATAATASKLWQKPPISPLMRRARPMLPTSTAAVAPSLSPPAATASKAKVTTCLQVTPSPATPAGGGGGGGGSGSGHQRSFTSVNLTLRPPSVEPQPPIEITSANACLTYSTSSFDVQKGLESRLQITVSPTGGSVASYRRQRPRPHSCHMEAVVAAEGVAAAATASSSVGAHRSLPDLALSAAQPTATVLRQQARIDRLKIELTSERNKLVAMQQEVVRLEQQSAAHAGADEDAVNAELEKQLLSEIRHLRGQCERLTIEVDQRVEQQQQLRLQQRQPRSARAAIAAAARSRADEEFYSNIYLGQRHPPNFGRPAVADAVVTAGLTGLPAAAAATAGPSGGWSCPKCTFHNHPDMGKCEQCDMPYILHVSAAPGDNIHIHVTPRISRRIVHSWVI